MTRTFMKDLPGNYSDALNDIFHERRRQIEKEGWTPEHDDSHGYGDMAKAAAAYAYVSALADNERKWHRDSLWGIARGGFGVVASIWPWNAKWFKPTNQRRDLVKAGALIVAEIERIDRATAKSSNATAAE